MDANNVDAFGAAASTAVVIHPLAIAGMCDHLTRSICPPNASSSSKRSGFVGGLLFGHSGTGQPAVLRVLDSVEVVSLALDCNNASTISRAEVSLKLRLQGASDSSSSGVSIMPVRRAVGWYVFTDAEATDADDSTTPPVLSPEHAAIHQSLVELTGCQDLVVLVLHSRPKPSSHQLPFACFARVAAGPFLQVAKCTVQSSDTERVALSRIAVPSIGARLGSASGSGSNSNGGRRDDADHNCSCVTIEASDMIKSTSAAQSASLAALADRIKAIEHVLANLQDSQSIDFDFLRAVEKIEKRLKLARKMVEETQHTNAEVPSHLVPALLSNLLKLFSDSSNLQKKYMLTFSGQHSD